MIDLLNFCIVQICPNMSKYVYQVWDKIVYNVVGPFDSHNKVAKEIEKLIQARDAYWEEYDYEIRKVNSNK